MSNIELQENYEQRVIVTHHRMPHPDWEGFHTRERRIMKNKDKKKRITCAQVRKLIVKIIKKREEVGKKYMEYEELVKKAIKLDSSLGTYGIETLNEMD